MLTCLRYQLRLSFQSLLAILGMTILIVGANLIAQDSGIFQAYYSGWPIGLLIVALLQAVGYTSTTFQIALSFGANRKDYFGALLLNGLILTLFSIFALSIMQACPTPSLEEGYATLSDGLLELPLPAYGAIFYTLFSLGSLFGVFMMKHRKFVFLILMALSFGAIIGLMMCATAWHDIPWLVPVFWIACLSISLVSNIILYGHLRRGEVVM